MIEPASLPGESLPASEKPEPWPSRHLLLKRLAYLVAGSAIMMGLLLSRVPVCPAVNLTGHPCPGCGLTRATFACLHGDLGAAARLQPLVFLVTPLVVVCAVIGAISYLKVGRARFSTLQSKVLMPPLKLAYGALIALWIVRFFGVWGGPVPVDPSLIFRLFHM